MRGGRGKGNMPQKKEALDYFGQFLMKNYRDKTLNTLDVALANKWKSVSLREFQAFLQTLNDQQRKTLSKGFQYLLDSALHDLLFSLQEENHFEGRIQILVDGYDVVELSDGIHGEQFGEDGWIEKYSDFKRAK
jgi:hypothetical protein